MFVGHLALGLAAKRVSPRVSLAVLFSAAQLADILWPVFIAIGVEQVRIAPGITAFTPLDFVSYPYSHSLVFLIGWGVAFGVLYRRLTGDRVALAVIAALVVSHWVLDFVTHRPDMPIYPGQLEAGPRAVELNSRHLDRRTHLVWRWAVGLPAGHRGARQDRTLGLHCSGRVPRCGVRLVDRPCCLRPSRHSMSRLWRVVVLLTIWSWWADRHRMPRRAA